MPTEPHTLVPVLHPRPDDQGRPVQIHRPCQPSAMVAWADPSALACVIPGGPMPAEVNGIVFEPWAQAPGTVADWEALAAKQRIDEPDFVTLGGFKPAAGVVIREVDGRAWLVAPSNAYGGYKATFPKGGLEGKSAQATALVETFEECGLQVRLIRHLIDVRRSASFTRYYLAERVGGHPGDMGWESQAVMLCPVSRLHAALNSPHDAAILDKVITGK